MAERFSLKDHLFNARTIQQLAREYSRALPNFDAENFANEALEGFANRELMARLDWLADCVERRLDSDFDTLAAQLEAAMPPPLDQTVTDDDFGQFIHAVPGILAVRHGLENHHDRALDLIYQATQRFSMEFYIRPFLDRWPDDTLVRLHAWADDENYHVRRLVSEGTRPRLPWAKAIRLSPDQTMPLLDRLHADHTRYVTRSVSNHLNDVSKSVPDLVVEQLSDWKMQSRQDPKELAWMTRHALRTLIKSGHPKALKALGYRPEMPVQVALSLTESQVTIGDTLVFTCQITAEENAMILVDYRIVFARPSGRSTQKVFKLSQGHAGPEQPFSVAKTHRLKPNATTFRWHPGPHRLILQVNGVDRAEVAFTVDEPPHPT